MKICIAGKNDIAVEALKHLIALGVPVSSLMACFNRNDDGQHSWQPSFRKVCETIGIREVSLSDVYDVDQLIFISLEFDRIIKPSLFSSTQLFNIHFSKLPAYKGMYTAVMPLLNGEGSSGVTLHKIEAGIDTGDVIDQVVFPINNTVNALDLYELFLKKGLELFKKNIQHLLSLDYQTTPQDIIGSSYYSKKVLDFSNIQIDLNKTSWEIHNQIRAFSFRYYQLPVVYGSEITHAVFTHNKSSLKSGSIISEDNHFLEISTVDYNLLLYKDQLPQILAYAESGNVEGLAEMKDMGYKLDEKNKKGWNALIVAAYNEQYEVCAWLLEQGASPNTTNIKGTSVLMYAMSAAGKSNRLELLTLLLNAGADPNHEDLAGYSLQYYASKVGNQEVYDFLTLYFLK